MSLATATVWPSVIDICVSSLVNDTNSSFAINPASPICNSTMPPLRRNSMMLATKQTNPAAVACVNCQTIRMPSRLTNVSSPNKTTATKTMPIINANDAIRIFSIRPPWPASSRLPTKKNPKTQAPSSSAMIPCKIIHILSYGIGGFPLSSVSVVVLKTIAQVKPAPNTAMMEPIKSFNPVACKRKRRRCAAVRFININTINVSPLGITKAPGTGGVSENQRSTSTSSNGTVTSNDE